MPIYITQGRYTRDAIKGMIIKPEDRADQVSRLLSKVGGRLIGYYLTFGDYDFLSIAEVPNDTQMAAVLLAAGSGGGVTDLRTTVAMTSIEARALSPPPAISRQALNRPEELERTPRSVIDAGNKPKHRNVSISLNKRVLIAHDLIRKLVPTFRDHALGEDTCSKFCAKLRV
jgi:uncharacterized protein with GYD domain